MGLALASEAVLYVLLRSRRPVRAPYLLAGGVAYVAFAVAAVVSVFL